MNVWETPIESFDLTKLKCYSSLKKLSHLEKSLGTLGGGNHFIEIEQSVTIWLFIQVVVILENR